MAIRLHRTVARALALSICLLLVAGNARAAASSKLHTDAVSHYAFAYPATWQQGSQNTSHNGRVAISIASTLVWTESADRRTGLAVLVAQHATTGAVLKSTLSALVSDGTKVVGRVRFDSTTINGIRYLRESGLESTDSNKYLNRVCAMAASRGSRTYYVLAICSAKLPAATSRDRADLALVLASFRLT